MLDAVRVLADWKKYPFTPWVSEKTTADPVGSQWSYAILLYMVVLWLPPIPPGGGPPK